MRKDEQKQWDYLDAAMKGRWDVQRHEDRYSTSIPDLSFALRGTDGWIELKVLSKWPTKPASPVNIAHLDSGQVNWAEQRGKAGHGNVWLLLAVGEDMGKADWFLIPWNRLREVYERDWVRTDFYKVCDWCTGNNLSGLLVSYLVPW